MMVLVVEGNRHPGNRPPNSWKQQVSVRVDACCRRDGELGRSQKCKSWGYIVQTCHKEGALEGTVATGLVLQSEGMS